MAEIFCSCKRKHAVLHVMNLRPASFCQLFPGKYRFRLNPESKPLNGSSIAILTGFRLQQISFRLAWRSGDDDIVDDGFVTGSNESRNQKFTTQIRLGDTGLYRDATMTPLSKD